MSHRVVCTAAGRPPPVGAHCIDKGIVKPSGMTAPVRDRTSICIGGAHESGSACSGNGTSVEAMPSIVREYHYSFLQILLANVAWVAALIGCLLLTL
jgi:hypothetical protein